jgi:hydrogenase expression/formation protein HypC
MCLAVPVTVRDIPSPGIATVEVNGVSLNVASVLIEDLKVGEYVLVHAGFIIERLDTQEAEERIDLINDLYENENKSGN